MDWWAWVAVGAILLGSELAFVDAQFYLVFIGASALAVGLAALSGAVTADWLEWLLFAALAVASMLTFRRALYERIRARLPVVRNGFAGESIEVALPLEPQATGRVEYRGSTWDCRNAGDRAIPAGGRARIERVDGLTLVVHAEN